MTPCPPHESPLPPLPPPILTGRCPPPPLPADVPSLALHPVPLHGPGAPVPARGQPGTMHVHHAHTTHAARQATAAAGNQHERLPGKQGGLQGTRGGRAGAGGCGQEVGAWEGWGRGGVHGRAGGGEGCVGGLGEWVGADGGVKKKGGCMGGLGEGGPVYDCCAVKGTLLFCYQFCSCCVLSVLCAPTCPGQCCFTLRLLLLDAVPGRPLRATPHCSHQPDRCGVRGGRLGVSGLSQAGNGGGVGAGWAIHRLGRSQAGQAGQFTGWVLLLGFRLVAGWVISGGLFSITSCVFLGLFSLLCVFEGHGCQWFFFRFGTIIFFVLSRNTGAVAGIYSVLF